MGEKIVQLSLLPLHSKYAKVTTLSGKEVNIDNIKKVISTMGARPFDIILFGHSNKNGHHLLNDNQNKSVLVSPIDLGMAINSTQLRYFYTSGCYGSLALRELKAASGAKALIGHKGTSMIPAVPFFALDFFDKIAQGVLPENALDISWKRINSTYLFRHFLIPLNEFNSGQQFTESVPVIL